jgi:hypothetical protein
MRDGFYRGKVFGLWWPLGLLWRGKVVRRGYVSNVFPFGWEHFTGSITPQPNGEGVVLYYPRLGLCDRMVEADGEWVGWMDLFYIRIWFTLRSSGRLCP